jgi:hypothetical protein
MKFYGARPYRPSSAAPLTIFTINTDIINEARRRGAETPEHEEFCKQFCDNRIELALERHNLQYLKNQRRSPAETRFSNSYYIYSRPATPDESPGKQKEAATPDEVPGKWTFPGNLSEADRTSAINTITVFTPIRRI